MGSVPLGRRVDPNRSDGVLSPERLHESAGDVVVDSELLEIFRGYHARAKSSSFVIESKNEPDVNAPFEHYRCHAEFVDLIAWLRSKGVVSSNATS